MAKTSSLLPYLKRQRGAISINLLPWPPSEGNEHSTHDPFRILDDSSPFCTLLSADLITDAATCVRNLLLVKQKDAYTGRVDLASNEDIDASWIRARETMDARNDPCIWLAAQNDSSSHLQQLSSLFLCTKTSTFFHPPCPECGQPLELCTRDDILEQSGLAPYSTSMERFLYCPGCVSQQAEPAFYTFSPNRLHPPCVLDHQTLIKGFGSLRESPPPELDFPCPSCPSFSSCFAADHRNSPPIVPFGFYPFFLFIFEQPTLRADDFLALVSGKEPAGIVEARRRQGDLAGASQVEEVMTRFQGQLYLTPEGPARFVEVLILKLSFLLEAMEHSFATARPETAPTHVPGGSSGSFWIKLPERSKSLPLFWDFQVNCFTIEAPERTRVPASLQLSHRVNDFGLTFFSTLLANQEGIAGKLDSSLQASDQAIPDWDTLFPPESMFWHAQAPTIPPSALEAWHASLSLGWALLTWRPGSDANSFLASQRQKMNDLLSKLRQTLFALPHKAQGRETAPEPSNLLNIVDDIIASWTSEQEPEKAEPQPEPEKDEDETILFNLDSEQAADEDTMSIDETRVETVFLSLDQDRQPSSEEKGPDAQTRWSQQEAPEPDLEKTVLIPPGQEAENAESPQQEADLEATVLLSSQNNPPVHTPVSKADTQSGRSENDDDLEKTVILDKRSKQKGGRGHGQG
jgi:hypothetical protein